MTSPVDIACKHAGSLAREMQVATGLALQAGDIALRYHGQDISVDLKPGDEPVTVADRACSTHIVAGLQEAFPEDVVISEECADLPKRRSASRVWYVDPIDGTKAFIQGGTGYAVMLGLALAHQPVLGVLYQPNHQSLLVASTGNGALSLRHGTTTTLSTSSTRAPRDARYISAGTRPHPDHRTIAKLLGMGKEEAIASFGLKLSAIAIGASDLYVNPYTNSSSWDTCAPQVILQEAGGKLTNIFGQALRYDLGTTKHQHGIVASNGAMHDETVRSLMALVGTPPEALV